MDCGYTQLGLFSSLLRTVSELAVFIHTGSHFAEEPPACQAVLGGRAAPPCCFSSYELTALEHARGGEKGTLSIKSFCSVRHQHAKQNRLTSSHIGLNLKILILLKFPKPAENPT